MKIRADYKLVAKALGRIGSSYQKLNDLPSAIKYFEKSLTEHRTPDILTKLREVEKARTEADRLAYIDPAKSEAAREEGNTAFKGGDFAGAVKSYTEAIKRDPKDPRGYNNRAAAYQKLVAFPEALKDANAAIEMDPTFGRLFPSRCFLNVLTPCLIHEVKAYIRKSHVLFAMRDYMKAIEAVQEAEEHDTEHKHKSEIQQQVYKCQQALFSQREGENEEETLQRAMRDPEIAVSFHLRIYSHTV
jgi:stress-induced-phosphoprotein 1